MLQLFPWATWLAAITSAVLLPILWSLGDVGPRSAGAFLGAFLLAGYLQFFSASPIVRAVGLSLQTLVAIGLILRWKRGV